MIKSFILSRLFSNLILFVVFINSVVLGLQTSPSITESIGPALNIIDKVCLYIFVVEAILKIYFLRIDYFKRGWNLFDLFIVIISLAADFPAFSSFRALRIIRVFRALKFISGLRNLQIIVSAIGRSIPSIGWTALLMLLIYYIFAVVGTMLFSESYPAMFGSIGKTMYLLFQIMTLDSWSMDICRPIMQTHPYAWVYFVPFVIISSFVILNIVVGIVVNSISDVANSRKANKIKDDDSAIEDEIHEVKAHLNTLEALLKKRQQEKERNTAVNR